MRSESITHAMLSVLSAMFEALPPAQRRKAAILIAESADFVDNQDAKRLMATFSDH
jgi:hypothetical protein